MVSFNFVPANIRVPGAYAEIDNSKSLRGLLPAFNHRLLVVGQRLATGSVAASVPTQIFDADQAQDAFGQGSMLHRMFKALAANNGVTETWAVALDDAGAGVLASGTITFTSAASQAGTLYLYVGGRRVAVAVASADTVTDIAANVVTAVTADADLPVTATSLAGAVTFTARHKGENGNDIDIRVNYRRDETAPAGLAWAIVAMAGGTANPDIAGVFTAIGGEQYEWIVNPWTDAANLTALNVEMASRWQPPNNNEGHAFSAKIDTIGALTTFGNGLNSPHLSVLGMEDTPTPPEEIATAFGAVAAFNLNQDPARPLQTLPLRDVLAPPEASRWTWSERNVILFDGIGTTLVTPDGTVLIERAITTYQTNASVAPDPSYLDITTMATLAFLRRSWRAAILQKFPRHKLADDGTRFGAGQAIVTPGVIRGETVALARLWEENGLVENLDQFKTELIVARNTGDANRVDLVIPPDLVNQARIFAAKFEYIL